VRVRQPPRRRQDDLTASGVDDAFEPLQQFGVERVQTEHLRSI